MGPDKVVEGQEVPVAQSAPVKPAPTVVRPGKCPTCGRDLCGER